MLFTILSNAEQCKAVERWFKRHKQDDLSGININLKDTSSALGPKAEPSS
jgi:hypothetical protein